MNEETTIPSETGDSVPSESTSLGLEETNPSVVSETVTTEKSLADWFTDPTEVTEATEGISFYSTEETVAETVAPVTVEFIETATSTIVHADLFGSFLICGTLIGLFIFRGRYGN